MEFRIAPMVIAVLNVLFITFAHPEINSWIPLRSLADYSKTLLPFSILLLLSLGAFFRHSYYSLRFKFIFWALQVLGVLMAVYYVVSIQAQHI